jgi:hypothetical protein
MLTLFTTAKPFEGHSGVIQRNALKSWKLLHPDIEIILFGDDADGAEIANELGSRHEPFVERNEFGTKRLSRKNTAFSSRVTPLIISLFDVAFTDPFHHS